MSSAAPALTKQGIAAYNAGNRPQAGALFIRAIQADPGYEMAWLWLSSCLSDEAERRYCMEQALKANPQSAAARRGLAQLGQGPSRAPAGLTEATTEDIAAPPDLVRVSVAPIWRRPAAIVVLLLVALLAVGVLSQAYLIRTGRASPAGSCDSRQFVQQVEPLAREWDDTNALANQTPRAALVTQIDKLQSIRRRVEDVSTPQCAVEVKQHLVDAMDNSINGYLAFLAQKPDDEVNLHFDAAKRSLDNFTKEIDALKNK